ncbi:C-signal protein [Magnaporthiopsis poae ATCC 64411]|uniref:C-signal protein n=1 Tax=Magnaporthiopsis poae (strain ATCC 64411 / 73-15) TaxID=644358 RepID=A0A0C4EAT1_MAGP6|nr:C-signal protein [Magnaporthiopsis poae ATCC 64411]
MPVYCVTGANRGLGLEFVRQLALQRSNTILATTRSLGSDLTDLRAAAEPSAANVHVLECDTGSEESVVAFAAAASKVLSDGSGSQSAAKIDYLINNGAVNLNANQSSLDLAGPTLAETMRVNMAGPQQTVSRLHAAGLLADGVRVVNISSRLGSIAEAAAEVGDMDTPCCAYRVSKAALNMLSVQQARDLRSRGGLKKAVVIAICPGWVQTRMGGTEAALTPEQSIGEVLKVIGGLGDADNGRFFLYNGKELPW